MPARKPPVSAAPPWLRAEAYDCFFGDRSEETAFWASQAARYGRELYEPMIGTAEVAAGLVERGFHVRGVDISPAMLAVAHRRCPDLALWEGDALAPTPFEEEVDFAYVPAGSFQHLIEPDDLNPFFASVRGALRRNGGIGITFWPPPAEQEPWGERYVHGPLREPPSGWVCEKTTIRQWSPATSILTVTEELRTRTHDGDYLDRYAYRLRLWSSASATELLREAGFHVEAAFGGYRGEPLNAESDWCLLVARRV